MEGTNELKWVHINVFHILDLGKAKMLDTELCFCCDLNSLGKMSNRELAPTSGLGQERNSIFKNIVIMVEKDGPFFRAS